MHFAVAAISFFVVLLAELYVLSSQPQWLLWYAPFRLPQERRVRLEAQETEPVDAGYRDAAERVLAPVRGRAPARIVLSEAPTKRGRWRGTEAELVAAADQTFFALRGTVGRRRKNHFLVRIDVRQDGSEVVLTCRQGLTQWLTPLATLPFLFAMLKNPIAVAFAWLILAPTSVWWPRSATKHERDVAIEQAFDHLAAHLAAAPEQVS